MASLQASCSGATAQPRVLPQCHPRLQGSRAVHRAHKRRCVWASSSLQEPNSTAESASTPSSSVAVVSPQAASAEAEASTSSQEAKVPNIESILLNDTTMLSWPIDMGNPLYFLAGLFGFWAVAHDVFAEDSIHLLAPLDTAGNSLTQLFDLPTRKLFWGKFVSNGFIWSASAAWIVATAAAVSRKNPQAWAATGTAWGSYLFGAGCIQKDPWLMDWLKNAYERARPLPPLHSTYSFPSGHAAADTLMVGVLLFVLLPALWPQRTTDKPEGNVATQLMWRLADPSLAWPLLLGSMAVTNIGRVVAGAHWPTDVMAGDLLGLALVSGTVVAARAGAAAAEERWGGGTDTLKHKP